MNIFFLKDCFINKEIAFILDIPYKCSGDEYNASSNTKNIIFALDDEDKKMLEGKGLKYLENYIDLDYICDYLDNFNRPKEIENRKIFERKLEDIELIPLKKLSLSEMFIKVLYSKPKDIECKEIDIQANIDDQGDVWGCCPGWITKPFGNIINDENCYDNYYARIIKLSYINKTFCFCDLKNCKYNHAKEIELDEKNIKLETDKKPKHIIISTDRTCNLRCNSCRKEFYVPSKEQKEKTHLVTQKILETNWIDEIPFMIAGQGEAFFSEEYLNLLKTDKHRKHLEILTNGTLFNEEKWKLIENKYDEVSVGVSIDAVKKETYEKLRHGNFDMLMKNLGMISKLREQGKIQFIYINFVVQKENMNEMIDFVELAKSHNADTIQFTKLNNWGTMTEEEYKESSLIIDDYLVFELYQILSDPIFKDEKVDISSFKTYYEKSNKIYKESEK